ncbi:hypothetical protein [Nostoc sp. 'Peltigera membranacea cyanobiont' 210A]|uniref:hypothetical protein n=1 Tax=Nostoc sp. 'Peltigera membranacea cyanobiont' 210A TaxID=2014529 RepID=UPI00167E9B45|nr:hypothetical protein [Nostoc sp. 'Peltigera membranacea cyanobiont' 210A]
MVNKDCVAIFLTRMVLQIIPFDQKLLDEGWMLYSQRPDKDWGLTDCISFAVMTQEGIT